MPIDVVNANNTIPTGAYLVKGSNTTEAPRSFVYGFNNEEHGAILLILCNPSCVDLTLIQSWWCLLGRRFRNALPQETLDSSFNTIVQT